MIEKLVNGYFNTKGFEKSGRVYEVLGINLYRKLYFATVGKVTGLTRGGLLLEEGEELLEGLTKFTRQVEGMHLVMGAVIGLAGYINWCDERYAQSLSTAGINVLGNVYPVMLQRYTRSRVNKLLERRTSKK